MTYVTAGHDHCGWFYSRRRRLYVPYVLLLGYGPFRTLWYPRPAGTIISGFASNLCS